MFLNAKKFPLKSAQKIVFFNKAQKKTKFFDHEAEGKGKKYIVHRPRSETQRYLALTTSQVRRG